MKRVVVLLLCCAAFATGARAQVAPCCSVTGINAATGVVSAKVNANGETFQFRLTNANVLKELRAGQGVFANFTTHQVSLDGKTIAGPITSGPQAAAPVAPPRAAPLPPVAVRPDLATANQASASAPPKGKAPANDSPAGGSAPPDTSKASPGTSSGQYIATPQGNINNAGGTPSAPGVGSFVLSTTPSQSQPQTVFGGSIVKYVVTVTGSGGFIGAVLLNASQLPPGWKATFDPPFVRIGSRTHREGTDDRNVCDALGPSCFFEATSVLTVTTVLGNPGGQVCSGNSLVQQGNSCVGVEGGSPCLTYGCGGELSITGSGNSLSQGSLCCNVQINTIDPFTASPTSFPSTPVGSTGGPLSVTLTNNAPGNVTVASVSISGPGFALQSSNCNGKTLAHGSGCAIAVTFTPTARDVTNGIINVVYSSPLAIITSLSADVVLPGAGN